MYKTILFDFDGTVFDTVKGIERSVKYALDKNGIVLSVDSFRRFAGPPFKVFFKEQYGFDDELIVKIIEAFREDYLPYGIYESSPFPGIAELLDELRQNGFKLAIATLKPRTMAVELLERSGLYGKFDVISGQIAEGIETLTKAEIVRGAMDMLGAAPEDTVLVGDTKYDVVGGHEAGLKVIGVRYGYAESGELENAGADIIVETLGDLKKLFLNHAE